LQQAFGLAQAVQGVQQHDMQEHHQYAQEYQKNSAAIG
jgi:hypothetical protein